MTKTVFTLAIDHHNLAVLKSLIFAVTKIPLKNNFYSGNAVRKDRASLGFEHEIEPLSKFILFFYLFLFLNLFGHAIWVL